VAGAHRLPQLQEERIVGGRDPHQRLTPAGDHAGTLEGANLLLNNPHKVLLHVHLIYGTWRVS